MLNRTIREALRSDPGSVPLLAAKLEARQPWADAVLGWIFLAFAAGLAALALFEDADQQRQLIQARWCRWSGCTVLVYVYLAAADTPGRARRTSSHAVHDAPIEAALGFATGTLGFTVDHREELCLCSREAGLILAAGPGDEFQPGTRRFAYYFDCRDVDSLYAELKPKLDALPKGDVHGPPTSPTDNASCWCWRPTATSSPSATRSATDAPFRKKTERSPARTMVWRRDPNNVARFPIGVRVDGIRKAREAAIHAMRPSRPSMLDRWRTRRRRLRSGPPIWLPVLLALVLASMWLQGGILGADRRQRLSGERH